MRTPLSGRWYRRLLPAALGMVLATGMLGTAPAGAAGSAARAAGRALVRIVSPADGADIHAAKVPVTIRLLPGARSPSLKVELDFRNVTAKFHRRGRTAQAMLTPQDGLVDGNNVLTVSVAGPAGTRSTAQVIFQSQGLLGAPAGLPPTFPLETRVIASTEQYQYAVRVGDVTHVGQAVTDTSPLWCGTFGRPTSYVQGAWVLVLDRKTLHPVNSVNMPLCTDKETAALGAYLAGLPDSDMVVVNSLTTDRGTGNRVNGLGKAVAKIGAVQQEFEAIGKAGNGNTSYSVAGIPGLPPGQAYQAGGSRADESGLPAGTVTAASINSTLVQDNNSNYTLDMRDNVIFQLDPDGTITVGAHKYPPPPSGDPGFAAGFHVLVLDRRTLAPLSDKLYPTADTTGPAGAQADMANDLTSLASSLGESVLVFIASVGHPFENGDLVVHGPTIPQALALFGGTPNVVGASTATPYALVGAVSPPVGFGLRPFFAPEASPIIRPGATGELDGVLQRGTRGMWYSPAGWNAPAVIDINGQQQVTAQNYGLYRVLAQAPTDWQHPSTVNPDPGELAAYKYLSQLACNGCGQDIRSVYDSDPADIETWDAIIGDAKYRNVPQPPPFKEAQFDLVRSQLGQELNDVKLVDGLRTDMHQLITDSNALVDPALTDAYTAVEATIQPPSTSQAGSALYDILELLQAVVDIASLGAPGYAAARAQPEPEDNAISEAIGLVAAIVEAANDLADNADGTPEDQLQTTVGNLRDQAAAGFAASLTGLDESFGEIVSDWGRLSAVADGMRNFPGDWNVFGNEGQIVTAMTNGMKIGFYSALIPLAYDAVETPDLPTSNIADFCANPALVTCPFRTANVHNKQPYTPGVSSYAYAVNDPANGYAPRYQMTAVGKDPVIYFDGSVIEHANDPFPAGLMTDLTSAGYYPGWFFQRFPLRRTICPPGDFDAGRC